MEASKQEIKAFQGLSVIAMVCLHLFCRYTYSYSPFIFIGDIPLTFFLGQMGDFCVMGFAFCSGYAHFIKYENDGSHYFRNRMRSLLQLMINYWLVVIMISLVKYVATGEMFSVPMILKNLMFIENSMNGTWWYMTTFIFLIISSPLVIEGINRYPKTIALSLSVLYLISYIIRFNFVTENWFVRQFYLYGMTIAEYAIGIYICKYKILSKVKERKLFNTSSAKIIIGIGFLLLAWVRCIYFPTLFVAPICGVIIIIIFHIYYDNNAIFEVLRFMGNHSTNIWLTHFFVIGAVFPDLAFKAKYPLLIFLFTLGISIIASFVLKTLLRYISRKTTILQE